jgi:hypothetical protein
MLLPPCRFPTKKPQVSTAKMEVSIGDLGWKNLMGVLDRNGPVRHFPITTAMDVTSATVPRMQRGDDGTTPDAISPATRGDRSLIRTADYVVTKCR